MEVKQKHPKERWAGVPIIVTSNSLPAVLYAPKRSKFDTEVAWKERLYDHDAFDTRIKHFHMEYKHEMS